MPLREHCLFSSRISTAALGEAAAPEKIGEIFDALRRWQMAAVGQGNGVQEE